MTLQQISKMPDDDFQGCHPTIPSSRTYSRHEHRFSLGRADFNKSVHWQRGLVLDDEYNGRALLEHAGNDVRITVRVASPEKFLSVLTRDVEWPVENSGKAYAATSRSRERELQPRPPVLTA